MLLVSIWKEKLHSKWFSARSWHRNNYMEKNAAEELCFDYLCGKCFSHASRTGRPGKVLSCCDFLCYDCGNGIQEPFTCPSCRKQNVKFVSTDDPSIPSEVARNISDPEDCIHQLKSVLLFQIKHYKTMLHRAVGKMMRDKKEFHRYKYSGDGYLSLGWIVMTIFLLNCN